MKRMRLGVALFAIFALLLAGCARNQVQQQAGAAADPVQEAISKADPAALAQNPREQTVDVIAVEYRFQPPEIRVKKGTRVTIRFANRGTEPHEFYLEAFNFRIGPIQPGQVVSNSFVVDKVGRFQYVCRVDQHLQKGMRGFLVVEE